MARQSNITKLLREATYCTAEGRKVSSELLKEIGNLKLDGLAVVCEMINIYNEVYNGNLPRKEVS